MSFYPWNIHHENFVQIHPVIFVVDKCRRGEFLCQRWSWDRSRSFKHSKITISMWMQFRILWYFAELPSKIMLSMFSNLMPQVWKSVQVIFAEHKLITMIPEVLYKLLSRVKECQHSISQWSTILGLPSDSRGIVGRNRIRRQHHS